MSYMVIQKVKIESENTHVVCISENSWT